MNLGDHFEPIESSPDGLRRVHRQARRRAIAQHLVKGTALLMVVVAISALPIMANSYFYNAGSSDTLANNDAGYGSGAALAPQSNALPGPDYVSLGTAFIMAGALLIVIATIVGALRANPPVLHFTWGQRVTYVVAALMMLTGALLSFG